MNRNGPIIIIEDDQDDQLIIETIYTKMDYTNELVFLKNGEMALEYLSTMKRNPFLIISDISMPKINGIELRAKAQQNKEINIKFIPYVLFSTTAPKEFIEYAYLLGIQGFFIKPSDPDELQQVFKTVIEYWEKSFASGMYE